MHLERHGEIEDRISERSGTVRRYTFNTLADIMKYWTELEYISLARIVIEDEEVHIFSLSLSLPISSTDCLPTNC
jgi:hypothetical protein